MVFRWLSVTPSRRLSLYVFRTLAWVFTACASTTGFAQLRDSFEGPQPTWSLSQADCGVRELVHERDYRQSRGGQSSEHFRLEVGNGTYVYLVQPIGRAPLIDELVPSLFVKADRPSVQLLARVVLPRSIDRGSGQPVSSFLRGEMYTAVGQWQQLAIREIGRLLNEEVRTLRTQFGAEIDAREAYIDMIVLNAYSGPGVIDVWMDELEIQGYVDLDETNSARIARRTATGPSAAPPESPAPTVLGTQLMVRGRPMMVRGVQHRGEPLEWLKGLGFNTVKLASSPSPADVREASRLNMWLIAPPPYSSNAPQAGAYEPVVAWSLGSRLTDRDVVATRQLIDEIRAVDSRLDRPLLAGVDSALADYGRLANLVMFQRPTLGSSHELADFRRWLLARPQLGRPGTPGLVGIETERAGRLAEQLILFGQGAAWEEDCDPEQIRLAAFQAIAAGARGLIFESQGAAGGLSIDNGPAALRTDAIRLVNMELKLLEPWIAAGQFSEELAAGDGSLQVSVLKTDRSRLLVATQHAPAQQYVLGPPPRSTVSLLVPGVGASDQAYLVSLEGIKSLKLTRTSGGARLAIENAPHVAAVVITQDPLAMHHLKSTLDDFRVEACHLRYDITTRRLIRTVEIDRQLSDMGRPLSAAAAWLREAHANLEQARRFLEANDRENCHNMTTKAEHLLAKVRRGHWESTAAAFPSPAASPCIAQFTTLPLHWRVAERMRGRWGPNAQAGGDMESLDQMQSTGWQQERAASDGIGVEVSLSLADPRAGRSALRMQAFTADAAKVPVAVERPLVWITSSPVPVRQGQMARISGWVNVPAGMKATTDGLIVFDSIGGPDLGDRIRLTQGWREFTLYRAVPQSGEMTVTFALSGIGEASVDELAISLLEPEPIRQVQ